MPKDDATQQVLDMRETVDRSKTRLTAAHTTKKSAEDHLAASDDAIEHLGLDPDHDLERQVDRQISEVQKKLAQLVGHLDEAEAVMGGAQ